MSFVPQNLSPNNKTVRHKGFTIVELLIAVVIIGILATISFVAYSGVRRTASEAGAKTELGGSTKAFASDQLLTPTLNNPTGSPYLYRETPSNTVSYAHGDTQSFCMEVRSKIDTTIVFYQFSGINTTGIIPGTCPTPNYRTTYRCVSGGVYSAYTLVNTTSRSVSFKINHSSTSIEENYAEIQPGTTKSGITNLRATSVQRGVISFNLYDYATGNYIDTYYQASPAINC